MAARERRPGRGSRAAGDQQATNLKSTPILSQTTPRTRHLPVWRPGCPCGCGDADECRAGRPVPSYDSHCCGALTLEQLAYAAKHRLHCQRTCVRQRLIGVTS